MSVKTGCECVVRDDGIYQMLFHDRSRFAIDRYFEHLERIYSTTPAHERVRLLVDTRPSGGQIPLLKYINDKSRELDKKLPQRPAFATVILIEMSIFTRIMDASLRLFVHSRDKLRIFDVDAFDQAVLWLNQSAVPA